MDFLFGKRPASVRSLVSGAGFAAAVALVCNFYFLGFGRNTTDVKGVLFTYAFIAICTFLPAIFTFFITRTLVRLLARNVTLARTFGVLSLELVSIKGIILAFAAILGMCCVGILIFAIQHELPVESGAALIIAFVTIMVGIDYNGNFSRYSCCECFSRHRVRCGIDLARSSKS
jgi:hypothetical protein